MSRRYENVYLGVYDVGDGVAVVDGEGLIGVGVVCADADCKGAVIKDTSVRGIAIIELSRSRLTRR